jgi:hypothetical protein
MVIIGRHSRVVSRWFPARYPLGDYAGVKVEIVVTIADTETGSVDSFTHPTGQATVKVMPLGILAFMLGLIFDTEVGLLSN